MSLHDMDGEEKLIQQIRSDSVAYLATKIHQDRISASSNNNKKHHLKEHRRRRCRVKNLNGRRIMTRDNSSNGSDSYADEKHLQTFIISKLDPDEGFPVVLNQPTRDSFSSSDKSKCQWTKKRASHLFRSLDREKEFSDNLYVNNITSQHQKESRCRKFVENSMIRNNSELAIRNEFDEYESIHQENLRLNNYDESKELLKNYRLVAKLLERVSSKQQVNIDDDEERKNISKYKADNFKKKVVVNLDNNNKNLKKKLKRSATVNFGLSDGYFGEESKKLFEKRTFKTYIEENFSPKDLRWKTNLVQVDDLDSNGEDQSTDDKGSKAGSTNVDLTSQSDEEEEPRNEIVVQDLFVDATDDQSSKQCIKTCANSKVAHNFELTNHLESSGKFKESKNSHKSREKQDTLIDYDKYKASLYNIPTSSLSSSGYVKPASGYSDKFDVTSSKVKLTKSSTSSSSQTPPLHISIENLRKLIEKNLVATLIGVYILVSLTVIMILMLPYLFNFKLETIETGANNILKASYEQFHKVDDQIINSVAIKTKPKKGDDKATQVDMTTNQDLTILLSEKIEMNKKGILSKDRQRVVINHDVSRKNLDKQPETLQYDTSNQQLQNEKQRATTIQQQQARKRGTRVSPLAVDQEQSKSLTKATTTTTTTTINTTTSTSTNSASQHTSTTTTTMSKDKFNGLWNVAHNRACLPLKVPFCNKSYGSIISSQTTSSDTNYNQASMSPIGNFVPYDKTLVPNQFSSSKQSQVEHVLQRYEPIIDIKCYALMPLFLCSIYAPKCIKLNQTQVDRHFVSKSADLESTLLDDNSSNNYNDQEDNEGLYFANQLAIAIKRPTQTARLFNQHDTKQANLKSDNWSRLVPPCRSLCKEAFRKCSFFFEVLSLKLLDPEDCDSFPESSNTNICIGQQEYEFVKRNVKTQICQDDKFRCSDGECIPKKWRCDGFADCIDKSDEEKCSRCNPMTQFYCGQDSCINKELVCNGVRDCRDGRDERQCLRLRATKNNKLQQKYGQGKLEVWSALKDSWIPVCGAHWSPMPMSHEACQALGYSRANETQILFESNIMQFQTLSTTTATTSTSSMNGQINYDKTLLSNINTSMASDSLLPKTSVSHSETHNVSLEGASASSKLRPKSRSGSWFEVTSLDSRSNSDDADGYGEMRAATDSEELAEIVEDMASLSSRLSRSSRSDHLVTYDQVSTSSLNSLSTKLTNGGLKSSSSKEIDLSTIYAAEVKLRSLTSMLYRGAESGCIGREPQLISSVHLECQNFQCGRPITSYTSRVRLQQRQQQQQQQQQQTPINTTTKRLTPVFRSLQSERDPLNSSDELDPSGRKRVRKLEASEEFNLDLIPENKYDDDDNILPVDEEVETNSSFNSLPISSRLVVGGIESMPGEFPYLAALHGGPDEVFFCGGVLISINWLLTAAHCVGNRTQADGWMVKVGVTRRIASPAFVRKLKVRKIIKHPKFNDEFIFNNDIALILLEESVEFNQYLRPICLPKANLKLGPDNSKECVVVGFGKSKFSSEANYLHVAHFVNVPIVRHSTCSDWYAEQGVNLTEGMLCAGYAEGKRDACQGDSGSGLFCRYSNTNQFFVAGVVSFGIKCATPKLPGVYTSVPLYVDWIEKTARDYGYPLGIEH